MNRCGWPINKGKAHAHQKRHRHRAPGSSRPTITPDPDRLPVADGLRHQIDRRRHPAQQCGAGRARGRRLRRLRPSSPPWPRRASPARCSSEITEPFPEQALLDRTSMNTWEDAAVIERVNEIGKSRHRPAPGSGPRVCIVGPALSAHRSGLRGLRASPTPAATSRRRRTTAPWTAWSRPARAR